MRKRLIAAVGSAVLAVGIAVSAGVATASSSEPRGGDVCTVNGDGNTVVAPFCGAEFAPAPATTPPPPPATLNPQPGGPPGVPCLALPPFCPPPPGGELIPGTP